MGTVEGGRRCRGRRAPPGAVGTSRPPDRRTLEHHVLRL